MKILRIIPLKYLSALLFVVGACFFIGAIHFSFKASSIGGGIGNETGALVGKAVGSFEGMTSGRNKGLQAGRDSGLNAEDTVVEIANELHQVNNLEVLVASVKLSNFHTIGDKVDYAALYLVNGNVVFSVDLNKADVQADKDILYITLPNPDGEIHIEESSIIKVAEYQKLFFNGDTEAGYDAYLNSAKQIKKEASGETLKNYDELISAAKSAAIEQVTNLIQATRLEQRQISISFVDKGGMN